MSRVDVLALLRDPFPDLRAGAEFDAAAVVVAELIAADQEYDAAVEAHKDLVRRIAEDGWFEISFDALRQAGERTMKAMMRRQDALEAVQGKPAEGSLPPLNVDVEAPRAPGAKGRKADLHVEDRARAGVKR